MKAGKVLLFIAAVIALLGLLGLLWPEKGVNIGIGTLSFPDPMSVLTSEKTSIHYEAEKDSTLMKDSSEVANMDEIEKMKYEVLTSENAIYFPDNNPVWMDGVFDQLVQAGKKHLRIIHYGDSQIEIDRMTSEIRHLMQSEFGGCGVGMIPAVQTVPTTAIKQSCSADMTRYIVYAPDKKLKSCQYGPMGQTAQLAGNATFTFAKASMKSTKPGTKKFARIGIFYENANEAGGKVTTNDTTIEFTLDPNETFACIDVGRYIDHATVSMYGNALIHGFTLDGKGHGVQVDNVAMRGCSGTIFTQIAGQSLATYFNHFDVPLVIMQFGGNAMPYLKPGKSAKSYCDGLRNQIRYIRKMSPKTKILFIGPSDMSTKIGSKMQTYEQLPVIVDSLKKMCLGENVAFWDLYEAMGGWNSMIAWVKANPQLAGPDYVHFTPLGAERAGKMLTNAILKTYEYYLKRNPEVRVSGKMKEYDIYEIDTKSYADGMYVGNRDTSSSVVPDSTGRAAETTTDSI